MPALKCEHCKDYIGVDDEWIIFSRRENGSCYHYYLCSDCFDVRACKDIRKCPKCFEWHDDPRHCPKCGAWPADVNKVIHEPGG